MKKFVPEEENKISIEKKKKKILTGRCTVELLDVQKVGEKQVLQTFLTFVICICFNIILIFISLNTYFGACLFTLY